MFIFLYLKAIAWVVGIITIIYLLALIRERDKEKTIHHFAAKFTAGIVVILFGVILYTYAANPHPPHFALPPFMQSKAPGGLPGSIPLKNIFTFFTDNDRYERVDDIGADPNNVPPLTLPDEDGIVRIDLIAQEVLAEVGDGITFNYWTYNNQVPGPMLRVREGDTVEISLTNHPSSIHPHNIDLHAVTGPGGGAAVTRVDPGETKTFRWKALASGLYVYHCATPNISTHNAHGQYGLILVEPEEGFSPVDKEFYVMQGELYTEGGLGAKGLVSFDAPAMLDGIPSYITFNGRLEETPRMQATVGDTVRMYVGNGGVNLISSFHVIGEIFDTVYPEASMGETFKNVQTTAVLPGGAAIVEFKLDVPGNYILVDHALARMNKGAWAILEVDGDPNPEIFTEL